jgi:hypothetical protein
MFQVSRLRFSIAILLAQIRCGHDSEGPGHRKRSNF